MASKSKSKKDSSTKKLPQIEEGKPFLFNGKICRIENNKILCENEENLQKIDEIQLPLLIVDEKSLYKQFSNMFIAILDGKIIGVADTLRKLHQSVISLVPEGKECTIRYIEEGVSLYGIEN